MFSVENTDQLKMRHHTTQELELQAKLQQQKKLLASPIVSSLPDKGEKIQKKIAELEHLLKTLQEAKSRQNKENQLPNTRETKVDLDNVIPMQESFREKMKQTRGTKEQEYVEDFALKEDLEEFAKIINISNDPDKEAQFLLKKMELLSIGDKPRNQKYHEVEKLLVKGRKGVEKDQDKQHSLKRLLWQESLELAKDQKDALLESERDERNDKKARESSEPSEDEIDMESVD